mgnify:FL=1
MLDEKIGEEIRDAFFFPSLNALARPLAMAVSHDSIKLS